MKKKLQQYLCDPLDKSDLLLKNAKYDENGNIVSGNLLSKNGNNYPIVNGIPRFIKNDLQKTVESFGNEWNYFNFDNFKINWYEHTIKNTFGTIDIFKGKIIVDAGGGSGMQSSWFDEAGAEYVICLELSNAVDDIITKNLKNFDNVDIIQCSIDQPPIKDNSIKGIVICHNVIQHTPSVENTAHALFNIVGKGGEFVFNCYPKNDKGLIRKIRLKVYELLRNILSKRSFNFILAYSKIMAILRFVPVLGFLLEKSFFLVRGDIPKGKNYFKRFYLATALNTFDCYGSHAYQHLKTDEEIIRLILDLQPDKNKILNMEKYFHKPQPIGCALRLFK